MKLVKNIFKLKGKKKGKSALIKFIGDAVKGN
jgi:hypothetical protein